MRSEFEVTQLKMKLESFNASIDKQIRQAAKEEFDSLATIFNQNAQLICALQWVLGEDTIAIH